MASATKKRGIISEINVTPLVDIMLVLLIIFMLTANLIAKQAIEVELPRASQATALNPTTLAITVTRDGALYLNGKTTAPAAFREAGARPPGSSMPAKLPPGRRALVGVLVAISALFFIGSALLFVHNFRQASRAAGASSPR